MQNKKKCLCICSLIMRGTGKVAAEQGKIYDFDGGSFTNEYGVSDHHMGRDFSLYFAEIDDESFTCAQQSKAGSEDSAQISAFVNWVASLSKTEYAAHEQLIAVIDKAQKLLPC